MTRRQCISLMAKKENWRQEEISALVKGVDDRIDVRKREVFAFLTSEKNHKHWRTCWKGNKVYHIVCNIYVKDIP